MSLAAISGVIERRILANYRIDPQVVSRVLPAPFRPKLASGYAIGGLCLIRLGQMRPSWLPIPWGLRSENAAHRIAVEWDEAGGVREGVFIPRRHTDSRWNVLAGGLVFPVVQRLAEFRVTESSLGVSVDVLSVRDGTTIHVSGAVVSDWPAGSVFGDLQAASDFFKAGALGYSADASGRQYHGIELACESWSVEALKVDRMSSSYFQDAAVFPAGSVQLDCALLMRGIRHRWNNRGQICCE
jgi:hypothetical protein